MLTFPLFYKRKNKYINFIKIKNYFIISNMIQYFCWAVKKKNRFNSPIIASSTIRCTSFWFFHVKDNITFIFRSLILVLKPNITSSAATRHATRYCNWWERLLLLLLLNVHPIPWLSSLQYARLLCHLDHQRLNPRGPPITTHVEHNMHYPY